MTKLIVLDSPIEWWERLRSAGADEIVFSCSGGSFTGASGYTPEAAYHAGADGVSLNRFYFPEDSDLLQHQLEELRDYDFKYIYFSDPAVFYRAEKMGMRERLIYNPDTLVTSPQDAALWMELGLAAVSISPLLTQEEIAEIGHIVKGTELPIHGRMLMAESRRPLLSAYRDHVRKPAELHGHPDLYIREESRNGYMPVMETDLGTQVYTDFVQASFAQIHTFAAAGIERFRIHAWKLTEQEVCDALRAYRAILNGDNAAEIAAAYREKYPDLPLSSGYYGEKTIK